MYNFFILSIALFSSRDTWAWEIPISLATSIWVRPSKKILEIIDNIPEKEAEEDKILKFELEDLRKRHQKSCDKLENIRKYLERQPKDKVILELQDLLERK